MPKLKPDDDSRRKITQQRQFKFRDALNKRRKTQSTTSTINLCDDILLEIFILLPDFPSLDRCSRVCKRWHSLIRNPDFTQNIFDRKLNKLGYDYHKTLPYTFLFQFNSHVQVFHSQLKLLMCEKSKILHGAAPLELKNTYLDFIPEKKGVVIRAQFRDLLLVSGPDYRKNYYVCNPLTKQFVSLPRAPDLDLVSDNPFRYGLVCTEKSFRVVLFNGSGVTHMRSFTASVFSSETRSWTVMPDVRPIYDRRSPRNAAGGASKPLYAGLFPWNNGGVVLARGGVVHWLTDTCWLSEERCLITAFNPYQSRCRLINLPGDSRPPFVKGLAPGVLGDQSAGLFLGACLDRLRLARIVRHESRNIELLKVWEMMDDERVEHIYSWRLVHQVSGKRIKSVVGFHPYNEDIVFVCVGSHWRVCEYNVKKQKMKKMERILKLKESPLICPIGSSISVVPILHSYDWPTSVPPLSLI